MERNKTTPARLLALAATCLLIAGCTPDGNHADLQQFMEQAKTQPQGEIEPLPTFRMYEAFKYSVVAQRSPFEKPLTATADDSQGRVAVKPDENREKEYLEGFNFAALVMVGTLEKDGVLWSLVDDGEGSVHRVTVGNYLGKNHGKIVSVSPSQLDVVEIVPDGKEGWVERPRALALKEND